MTVARCQGVRFTFPGATAPVLDDVSLEFSAGTTTAILGPSGAGKSTLLRLMAGLLPIDAGTVDRPASSDHDLSVAMVFQDPRLLPWMTVRQNVEFALEAAGVPRSSWMERWEPLMAAVGLTGTMHLRPAQLSGGMAQRVGVVRALALRPRLLLLDEPFGAVDPILRDQLQAMLARLLRTRDTTAVLVTHDVREAAVLADYVAILGGAPSSIRSRLTIDLPHPRDALGPEVTAVARKVRAALSDASAPVRP